jgi:hypothetical protein
MEGAAQGLDHNLGIMPGSDAARLTHDPGENVQHALPLHVALQSSRLPCQGMAAQHKTRFVRMRMLNAERDVSEGDGVQASPRVWLRGGRRFESVGQAPDFFFDQLREQIVLIREVPIDRSWGVANPVRQSSHRQAQQTFGGKQLAGGIEDGSTDVGVILFTQECFDRGQRRSP